MRRKEPLQFFQTDSFGELEKEMEGNKSFSFTESDLEGIEEEIKENERKSTSIVTN